VGDPEEGGSWVGARPEVPGRKRSMYPTRNVIPPLRIPKSTLTRFWSRRFGPTSGPKFTRDSLATCSRNRPKERSGNQWVSTVWSLSRLVTSKPLVTRPSAMDSRTRTSQRTRSEKAHRSV